MVVTTSPVGVEPAHTIHTYIYIYVHIDRWPPEKTHYYDYYVPTLRDHHRWAC